MQLDYRTLSELAEEHGDAFYLLSLDRFRTNARDLLAAFRAIHPRVSLAYSYKTNYTPALCRAADEEGCWAEVVSKLEYDLALRLGVPPQRILFNGPAKAPAEIEEALLAGAVVNLDSEQELQAVEDLARRTEAPLKVGVRCRFALEPGHRSRFGFDAESDALANALRRLRSLPGCVLHGLHCHFSAYRDATSFRQRARRMVELAERHFSDAPPATLDVGGGFFGRMPETLRRQFSGEVPTYTQYAEAVAGEVARTFPGADAPELILEPGAGVVADTVEFVCRVASLKTAGESRLAITTGSIQNVKATPNPIRLPLRVASRGEGAGLEGPLDITGYTCMEGDVLHSGHQGVLRVGDFILLGNVGAYTLVFKPPFIRSAPAILCLSDGSDTPVVERRKETLDDWLRPYGG